MKRLAAIAFLIAFGFGLPARADCPHNGRTDHPHCNMGSQGLAPVFEARDSNDQLIGEVISVGVESNNAFVRAEFTDSASNPIKVGFGINGQSVIANGELFFDTEDCFTSGNTFISANYLFDFLTPSVVIRLDDTRILYSAVPGAFEQVVTIRGIYDPSPAGGGCRGGDLITEDRLVLPGEEIDSDLHTTFARPYQVYELTGN